MPAMPARIRPVPVWFVVAALSFPGLWVLSRSASSASSGSAAGVAFAVDGRGGAAALAWPDLVAFFYGDPAMVSAKTWAWCRLKRAADTDGWSSDNRSLGWLTGNLGMP
jgi:hypothetical protein